MAWATLSTVKYLSVADSSQLVENDAGLATADTQCDDDQMPEWWEVNKWNLSLFSRCR